MVDALALLIVADRNMPVGHGQPLIGRTVDECFTLRQFTTPILKWPSVTRGRPSVRSGISRLGSTAQNHKSNPRASVSHVEVIIPERGPSSGVSSNRSPPRGSGRVVPSADRLSPVQHWLPSSLFVDIVHWSCL